MPTKKLSKSEKLPKYGTLLRSRLLLHVTKTKGYQENLNRGFPLFSHKELENIKKRYKDGLAWNEIEKELLRKKIVLKKPTFRKYIQEKNLPEAKGYRNMDGKRVAIFPADIISHINFIHYFYKVADGDIIDGLLDLVVETQVTYLEAIESKLPSIDNLYAAIYHYLCFNDAEAYETIEETLSNRQEDQQKALSMLEDIDKKFNDIIAEDTSKLISFLKEKYISPLEIPDDEK
jgi:hypothetical protein